MAIDPTLSAVNQEGSVRKYINETVGADGFRIVTQVQQVDFEKLARDHGGWITVELGASKIQPKMPIVLLVTLCARGNDSNLKMAQMIDSVREHLAPGTIFPLYDLSTRSQISGFMVDEVLEGVTLPQPGGGFNRTETVVLRVGVVC
jgi:hypothetical protein